MRCEQRTTTLSLPPFFISPFSLGPPESLRSRQTGCQRRKATAGRRGGGERGSDGRVNGREQGLSLLHPHIHHHVITTRADHRACERHFKDFPPGRWRRRAPPCVQECVCLCVRTLGAYAVCVQGSRSGCLCCSPFSEKKPAHSLSWKPATELWFCKLKTSQLH